jgi:hypothetical protein
MENTSYKRQIAYKVNIAMISSSKYVRKEGWEPNYLVVNGKEVSRINLIGVVIDVPSEESIDNKNMVIDDGSGQVMLRWFEDGLFDKFIIGDVVLVIGRPREFSEEVYIMPEIVRKLDDKKWIEVRKNELKSEVVEDFEEKVEEPEPAKEEKIDEGESDFEKFIKLIREKDQGDGADVQEIISQFKNGEDLFSQLLMNGSVFEIRSGRVKVLE